MTYYSDHATGDWLCGLSSGGFRSGVLRGDTVNTSTIITEDCRE